MRPYYDNGQQVIYHGDCREVLPQLESTGVVVTDPPYSDHVHGKSRRGGSDAGDLCSGAGYQPDCSFSRVRELGFESMSEELRAFVASEIARLVKRWSLVFSDVESCYLWRHALTGAGLDYVRTGLWRKLGATPQFTGDRPGAGFEVVTIAHPKGRKRWNGGGKHAVWEHPIVLNRSHCDPRVHTTQKPLTLMMELIALFSDDGDSVLDPFMGSGTTLIAAKSFDRPAIGIEREERYCEVAAKRLRNTTPNMFAEAAINA